MHLSTNIFRQVSLFAYRVAQTPRFDGRQSTTCQPIDIVRSGALQHDMPFSRSKECAISLCVLSVKVMDRSSRGFSAVTSRDLNLAMVLQAIYQKKKQYTILVQYADPFLLLSCT